MFKLKAAELKS